MQQLRSLLSDPELAEDANTVLRGGAPSERLVAALRGLQSLAAVATGSAAPLESGAEVASADATKKGVSPPENSTAPANDEEEISPEAFKAEVEAMIKASAGTGTGNHGSRGAIAEAARTLASEVHATKVDASLPLADFLGRLDLAQYLAAFQEDEIDLPTLAMVQRRQGSAALHEALKELGVSTRGHRLRIAAALA